MICAELTSLSWRWSYRQSRVSKVSIIVAFTKKVQCGNCVSGLLAVAYSDCLQCISLTVFRSLARRNVVPRLA